MRADIAPKSAVQHVRYHAVAGGKPRVSPSRCQCQRLIPLRLLLYALVGQTVVLQ